MPISPVAVAADYADAMLTARRAKNLLFALLLLIQMGQIGIFFAVRQNPQWLHLELPAARNPADAQSTPATNPTTAHAMQPSSSPEDTSPLITTTPEQPSDNSAAPLPPQLYIRFIEYLIPLTGFLAMVMAILLCVVQLLLVLIMLVGRLVGVSKVPAAFLWTLLLILFLFPWQSVLISPINAGSLRNTLGVSSGYEFKIPGVIYTWEELSHPVLGAAFDSAKLQPHMIYLRWARFVVWPVTAIIVLLIVQAKSSRGLRLALGEETVDLPSKNR